MDVHMLHRLLTNIFQNNHYYKHNQEQLLYDLYLKHIKYNYLYSQYMYYIYNYREHKQEHYHQNILSNNYNLEYQFYNYQKDMMYIQQQKYNLHINEDILCSFSYYHHHNIHLYKDIFNYQVSYKFYELDHCMLNNYFHYYKQHINKNMVNIYYQNHYKILLGMCILVQDFLQLD